MELNKFQCWTRKADGEMLNENKANDSVTFLKLFRFASNIDRILIAVSITACVFHGVTVPSSVVLFGNLARVLIEANYPGTNNTTQCQYSSSSEGSEPFKYV